MPQSNIPPYDVLLLHPNSTYKEIRKRYKQLIRKFTPENAPEKFTEINRAYQEILGEKEQLLTPFPIYQFPLRQMQEKASNNQVTNLDYANLLTKVPETIFDTKHELEELVND